MRVTCNVCGNNAVITKTNRVSLDAADMYCVCNCGHRFVWFAGFKHSLSGSKQDRINVIKSLMVDISDSEKLEIIQSLQPA